MARSFNRCSFKIIFVVQVFSFTFLDTLTPMDQVKWSTILTMQICIYEPS